VHDEGVTAAYHGAELALAQRHGDAADDDVQEDEARVGV
jgi:hypothetical protein